MEGSEALDSLIAEDVILSELDSYGRVKGPAYGGELQVDIFGILVTTGDGPSLSRFYNGTTHETKRLIEVLNGKIWVRDERY